MGQNSKISQLNPAANFKAERRVACQAKHVTDHGIALFRIHQERRVRQKLLSNTAPREDIFCREATSSHGIHVVANLRGAQDWNHFGPSFLYFLSWARPLHYHR